MSLNKLNLAPDQAGYAVTDGVEVASTQLDGGAGRYRKDIVSASALVQVQWRINPIEFRYLKSFYNLLTSKGSDAFIVDLYLDSEELTTHECHFVPGSFRLVGQQGKQFTVSARLEAKPVRLTAAEEEAENIWASLFGELGASFETLFPPIEADFDQVVTFNIRSAIGVLPPAIENIIQDIVGYSVEQGFADTKSVVSAPKVTGVSATLFDGGVGYVETTLSPTGFDFIQRTGKFCVSFWHRRDGSAGQEYIFDNENEGGSPDGLRIYWIDATATLSVLFRGSGGATILSGGQAMPAMGEMHFYEVEGDGVNIVWRQDGVQIGSPQAMATGNFGGTAPTQLRISQSFSSLNGALSNVKVSSPASTDIELVLMVGQSNMVGGFFAGDPITPPAEYDIQQSDWYYSYMNDEGLGSERTDRFVDLQSATFGVAPATDASWTAEIIVGKEMVDAFGPKQRAIIKVARGGTNSWADWSPGGQEYDRLVQAIGEMVDDLENAGFNPKISTVIVNQGEANCATPTRALNWASDWETIKSGWQSDTILSKSAIWHVVRVSTNYRNSAADTSEIDVVRAQQELFGGANGSFIDADTWSLGADSIHYDFVGKVQFGDAVASLMLDYVETEGVHLQYPLEEVLGGDVYDISPRGNMGSFVGTVARAPSGGIPSMNNSNGFREDSGVHVPMLLDGSSAADGNAVTNHGGYVHNGFVGGTQDTDADFGIFGGPNTMGNGVDTWVELSYSDYLASPLPDRNVFLRWVKIGGVCHLERRIAYPAVLVLTPQELVQAIAWSQQFTTECGQSPA